MSDKESINDDDEAISEIANYIPEDAEDEEVSIHSQSSQGRGRPRIAEQWTRVVSLGHDDLSRQLCFPLAPDLLVS